MTTVSGLPHPVNLPRTQSRIGLRAGRLLSTVVVYASFTWEHVNRATSGPIWYSIVLLAVAVLFGREMWATYRGTRPVALSLVSAALTIAAFGIVGVRLVALAR